MRKKAAKIHELNIIFGEKMTEYEANYLSMQHNVFPVKSVILVDGLEVSRIEISNN